MKLTNRTSSVRMITMGEKSFKLTDGYMLFNRAGLVVSRNCPDEYKELLTRAMRLGWIQPVAYVRDSELMWDQLQEEN